MELANDGTYIVNGMGSISFHMPSCDVLELLDVFYVFCLTRNLFSISAMTDLMCG